jgi:hypothetical protein
VNELTAILVATSPVWAVSILAIPALIADRREEKRYVPPPLPARKYPDVTERDVIGMFLASDSERGRALGMEMQRGLDAAQAAETEETK